MKLNGSTIKKVFLGAVAITAGYIGVISTGGDGGNAGPGYVVIETYDLLEPTGDWATWENAPVTPYAPILAAPVFDVTDYGAIPDDDLPDTEAIRAAIAACKAAAGGTVYLPAGEYLTWADGEDLYCFMIDFSGMTVEGDGPTETIINHRAWGGRNPTELIAGRGGIFSLLRNVTPTVIDGLTLRGFRATANANPTYNAGQATGTDDVTGLPDSYTGWDTDNKGIWIWGDTTNVLIEYTEWDNFRGEALYSGGGDELGSITVRKSIVRSTNSSAISMGGAVLIEDTDIYDVYNGTECFSISAGQSQTIRRCTIEPNKNIAELGIGNLGVVHLGASGSSLTVEDSHFGHANTAAIFMADLTQNATINNNTFTDVRPIYMAYLASYSGLGGFDPTENNTWNNIQIYENTATAETVNVDYFMLASTLPAPGQIWDFESDNWDVYDNVVINDGATFGGFLRSYGADNFNITGNTIPSGNPAFYDGSVAVRGVWTGNTVSGAQANGTEVFSYLGPEDLTPFSLEPQWDRLQIIETSSDYMPSRLAEVSSGMLALLPTGFSMSIRRTGSNSFHKGVEIQPDPAWNTLTRGYMVYEGAVLTLVKNALGTMDFGSYTPPTTFVPTLDQNNYGSRPSAADITIRGQGAVNLSPSVAHTFSTFSGVAIGETVTLNLNANVTLDHTAGVIEMSTGVDYVSSGTVALSATRAADGTLEVTIP